MGRALCRPPHSLQQMADDLESIRSDIARLRKLATKKISRTKRSKDAPLSGTQFDPRRAPKTEKRYTKRQAEVYRQELQGFLSRSTQFVGGANGFVMKKQQWDAYKKLEQQYNSRVNQKFDKVAGIQLPQGETLGSRMARRKPPHPQMAYEAFHAPYDPPVRTPKSVDSGRALIKLMDSMRNKANAKYDEDFTEKNRHQFLGMAERLGDDALAEKVKNLTDEQFNILWNFSEMPYDMSLWYETQKLVEDGNTRHPLVTSGAAESAKREYAKLVDWASKLKV